MGGGGDGNFLLFIFLVVPVNFPHKPFREGVSYAARTSCAKLFSVFIF